MSPSVYHNPPTVQISDDAEALALAARDWLLARIDDRLAAGNSHCSIALSGGSTPKRLYQLLAELPSDRVDWNRIILVWGDERNVPADHLDSNYRMVDEALLQHIDIPAENVLAVPDPGGEAKSAAQAYDALLRSRLGTGDEWPTLDCVLLGMGDDVHTASLFPETTALQEQQHWVVENWVEKLNCWRTTLTAPVINHARDIAFLVAGGGKTAALQTLWHGPRDTNAYPSQLVNPSTGNLWFLLDRSALGGLSAP